MTSYTICIIVKVRLMDLHTVSDSISVYFCILPVLRNCFSSFFCYYIRCHDIEWWEETSSLDKINVKSFIIFVILMRSYIWLRFLPEMTARVARPMWPLKQDSLKLPEHRVVNKKSCPRRWDFWWYLYQQGTPQGVV